MLSFVVNGRTYEWFGGFGNVFSSLEHGVKQGDVRVIHGELFYAYMLDRRYPRWLKQRVCWTFVKGDANILPEIVAFKKRIFGQTKKEGK